MSEMPPPTEPADTISVEPRKSGRGVVIGVSATVLAVVAGAAVWATTTLSGGGRQPDEVVPKTTFAYLKLDLDPAAGQKLAARSFFSKFPSLKDTVGNDSDDVFDDLLAEVIDDETLDYRTDIQPWFDKRAAVAAFSEGTKTHVVAALRSKDDGQAKAALDKALAKARASGDDGPAYLLTKGYAIIGDQPSVAAAVQLTENESLHDNTTYRDDVGKLTGDQVATGWTDVSKAFGSVKDQFGVGEMIPAVLLNQIKGRVVAGLHLSGDVAEIEGLFLGSDLPANATAGAKLDLLTGLPSNTAAAFAVNGLGKVVTDQAEGLPIDEFLGDYLQASGLTLSGDLLPLLMNETCLLYTSPSPRDS